MRPEYIIRKEEGFVSHAYPDSEGFLTIGIGTLIDKRKGGGITESEAFMLMRNRIEMIYPALDAKLPWWRSMSDVRQSILVSMAYQLGISGLLKFKNTLWSMRTGNYKAAARGILASKMAKQTPERTQRAAKAMETNVYEYED